MAGERFTPSSVSIRVVPLLAMALSAGPPAGAQTATSSRFVEPTIVSRYEGSVIKEQTQTAFDQTVLTTGVAANGNLSELRFEGRRTWTAMQGPSGRSAFEIFASYRAAISQAGFQTVYTCSREQCPQRLFGSGLGGNASSALPRALSLYGDGSVEDRHYLLARRSTPDGEEYIRLATSGPRLPVAVLDILQPAAREQKVRVLDRDQIASDIAASGRAVLYAIFFDFDSATIKPGSDEQLMQLAAYLAAHPGVNVYIVGHTDAKGALEYNADLAGRRAAAIVAALAHKHGVAAERLSARSVGELAPVSTNDTEAGRALNRRVEIVERID
jgi:outer membrane protein OmpA-like peptidoglycan-associated protein